MDYLTALYVYRLGTVALYSTFSKSRPTVGLNYRPSISVSRQIIILDDCRHCVAIVCSVCSSLVQGHLACFSLHAAPQRSNVDGGPIRWQRARPPSPASLSTTPRGELFETSSSSSSSAPTEEVTAYAAHLLVLMSVGGR